MAYLAYPFIGAIFGTIAHLTGGSEAVFWGIGGMITFFIAEWIVRHLEGSKTS